MQGKLRIPGMLDPHVHLRGMDWAHKGTFASETAAALAGGYWAVLDMPNTSPATVEASKLKRKLTEIKAQAVSDWGLYYGAAQNANWQDYDKISHAVCGLKIYNNATTGDLLIEDQTLRDAHFAAWPKGKVIAVHAEGDTVADILALVRKHRKHTHFCHISTRQEIDLLRAAKAEGLPISVGVCPHHLYLTEDDVQRLGPLGMMKPSLKTANDQAAIWEALDTGLVDVIESDHAPHTLAEKNSGQPTYGVPGLETTLPLLLLAIKEKRLTIEQLVDLVAENPRRIFALPCPPETYTVIDLEAAYTINRQNLHTLCGWSPFEGLLVPGKVIEVWIRGKKVYDGESILIDEGFGQNLYDPKSA